jgi:ABC-type uncharacterized transport system permease subunit
MNKILIHGFLMLIPFFISAQNKIGTSHITQNAYQNSAKTYSLENLQHASIQELEYYQFKAEKLSTFGTIATIFGGLVLGTALLIDDSGDIEETMIVILTGTSGLITMVIGIPMIITGKKRIKRINSIKNHASIDFGINIQPCVQYNMVTQNCQSGMSVRITF